MSFIPCDNNSPPPQDVLQAIPPSSFPRRLAKRRRVDDDEPDGNHEPYLSTRQFDKSDVEQALTDCQFNSGNNIISCFPSADTIIPQHQWASFVWNSRRPELTQTNLVDIALFRADSRDQVLHFRNCRNPTNQAGIITAQVNDSWWGKDGADWDGSNSSFPFFWVINRSDNSIDGDEIAQPTFSAVQTTFADFVVASQSASASRASASSASVAAQASHTSSPLPTTPPTSTSTTSLSSASGSLQSPKADSGFPHWAIAVIVVLGFLAIVALGILAFLIIRRIRRRAQEDLDSNRNSIGSASPMMANAAQSSPVMAGPTLLPPPRSGGSVHGQSGSGVGGQGLSSVVMHDGASTVSRTGSAGDPGPFSGADAALMADVFRNMLRKPDFAGDEGDSPTHPEEKEQLINRELAEEGRDIRSVGSSRGVKVEKLDDSVDTTR